MQSLAYHAKDCCQESKSAYVAVGFTRDLPINASLKATHGVVIDIIGLPQSTKKNVANI